jgi:hypothetical protein
MKTNTLSKETMERLTEFLNVSIPPERMAKVIRKTNYLLSLSLMSECENLQIGIVDLKNGFYWLNELAEILNPYLEIE